MYNSSNISITRSAREKNLYPNITFKNEKQIININKCSLVDYVSSAYNSKIMYFPYKIGIVKKSNESNFKPYKADWNGEYYLWDL